MLEKDQGGFPVDFC